MAWSASEQKLKDQLNATENLLFALVLSLGGQITIPEQYLVKALDVTAVHRTDSRTDGSITLRLDAL